MRTWAVWWAHGRVFMQRVGGLISVGDEQLPAFWKIYQRFDRFCVGCEQGAYGGVYTAKVVGSDRQFVVKVAYPDPELHEEQYYAMGGESAASLDEGQCVRALGEALPFSGFLFCFPPLCRPNPSRPIGAPIDPNNIHYVSYAQLARRILRTAQAQVGIEGCAFGWGCRLGSTPDHSSLGFRLGSTPDHSSLGFRLGSMPDHSSLGFRLGSMPDHSSLELRVYT
jgi:hypothetical protein